MTGLREYITRVKMLASSKCSVRVMIICVAGGSGPGPLSTWDAGI